SNYDRNSHGGGIVGAGVTDLILLAFTPTGGQYEETSCAKVGDCGNLPTTEWVNEYGNIGLLDLQGLPDGIPPLDQCPLCGPQKQPPPPLDPIWDALAKLKNLLANDPDCLSFLNSGGIDGLGRLATIMDGYYGQAGMLPTRT